MLLLENSPDVLSECLKSENNHRKPLHLPDPIPPKPLDNAFNQIAEITPYLYLSAATALTPSSLSRLEPSLVINVTTSLPMLTSTGLRLAVEDSVDQDILSHLDRVTAAIRDEADTGGRVLVHCVAGVSRSASLVLAYLTRYYCDLSSAWRHLKTVRPWVRPNQSFLQQLVQWEASLGLRGAGPATGPRQNTTSWSETEAEKNQIV